METSKEQPLSVQWMFVNGGLTFLCANLLCDNNDILNLIALIGHSI